MLKCVSLKHFCLTCLKCVKNLFAASSRHAHLRIVYIHGRDVLAKGIPPLAGGPHPIHRLKMRILRILEIREIHNFLRIKKC